MRSILILLLGLGTPLVADLRSGAQEEKPAGIRASEEERLRQAQQDLDEIRRVDRSPDLWYGTPGVRPGGDLLVPIRDLIRNPSSLLDFRPRKTAPWLPDRETAEFLRERR